MCAKDLNQTRACSQSKFIHELDNMLCISSSHTFLRDVDGEVIFFSPLFESDIMRGDDIQSLFSTIPVDIRVQLFDAELKSLSGMGPFLFRYVTLINYALHILIECVTIHKIKFVRWVFFKDISVVPSLDLKNCFSKEIDDSFSFSKVDDKKLWKVFHLYVIGFTIGKISRVTNLSEDQIKKMFSKIKKNCAVSDRDSLLLVVINTLDYSTLALNVLKILSGEC